jgi:hypothetical protein
MPTEVAKDPFAKAKQESQIPEGMTLPPDKYALKEDVDNLVEAITLLTDQLSEVESALQKVRMAQGGDAIPSSYIEGIKPSDIFLASLTTAIRSSLENYSLGKLSKGDALCIRQLEDSFRYAEEAMKVWNGRCSSAKASTEVE